MSFTNKSLLLRISLTQMTKLDKLPTSEAKLERNIFLCNHSCFELIIMTLHLGWPNLELVREICQDGCHLVAKQPKGGNIPDREKGFLWRFSFSAAEKKLFLRGGHGEASSCRKQVLRILKALKEELNLHPLKSYHLKTILLYECEANPRPRQWSSDRLSERFIGLLQRLENCLLQSNCPHFFIKHFNLFEMFPPQRCSELVRNVQQIRQKPKQVLTKLIQQSNAN